MSSILQKTVTLTWWDLTELLVVTLIFGVSAGVLILAFVANSRSDDP